MVEDISRPVSWQRRLEAWGTLFSFLHSCAIVLISHALFFISLASIDDRYIIEGTGVMVRIRTESTSFPVELPAECYALCRLDQNLNRYQGILNLVIKGARPKPVVLVRVQITQLPGITYPVGCMLYYQYSYGPIY